MSDDAPVTLDQAAAFFDPTNQGGTVPDYLGQKLDLDPVVTVGKALLYQADAFEWLASEP
jgi:hypothetical protein